MGILSKGCAIEKEMKERERDWGGREKQDMIEGMRGRNEIRGKGRRERERERWRG